MEFTKAYELKILEDDDFPKPEPSFDPLDREKKFTDYNIDSLVKIEF